MAPSTARSTSSRPDGNLRRRPQLSDDVAMHVRNLIMSGGVRPGDFIRLDETAAELGVSVTPVRAVDRLAGARKLSWFLLGATPLHPRTLLFVRSGVGRRSGGESHTARRGPARARPDGGRRRDPRPFRRRCKAAGSAPGLGRNLGLTGRATAVDLALSAAPRTPVTRGARGVRYTVPG